jgi:hypothetical protein
MPALDERIEILTMAEIKSTLELALERTKKFTISEKEKEEIKQKEISEKATSLFHRYRDGHLSLNEVQKEIERMDEKIAAAVKENLLSQWIDALSLNQEAERLLKGIGLLKNGKIDKQGEEFHHLFSQYREEKEKARQEAKTRLMEVLRKEGIDGDAVDPNVEGSPLWKEACEKLDRAYGTKLENIKKQLRSL